MWVVDFFKDNGFCMFTLILFNLHKKEWEWVKQEKYRQANKQHADDTKSIARVSKT